MSDMPDLDLHVLGSHLSEQLLDFQSRFAALKKKCDHSVLKAFDGCVTSNALGPHRQGVGFKRDGKEWKLYFVETGLHEREPNMFEKATRDPWDRQKLQDRYESWDELAKASLVEKSKAATLLPDLLESMQREYDRRAQHVSRALGVLKEFSSTLPPAKKEGA